MSKYPVVDYALCNECGLCVRLCPYMVYEKTKFPVPDVNDPKACMDDCFGCGNRCSQHAISFVGDKSGWKPTEDGSCSCGKGLCG